MQELNVSCSNGVVELTGKVSVPRGRTGTLNVRKELENLKNMVRTMRGVKDVFAERVRVFK